MKRTPFPFWRFSLRIYAAPGVAAACLALQDACGADVNLLLYACWLGLDGRQLGDRDMRRARAAVARWQKEVVQPLRQARRGTAKISGGVPREWAGLLHQRIGDTELDAEYVEQRMLAEFAAALPPPIRRQEALAAARANLERYLDLLGATIGRRERRHLKTLTAACFPGASDIEFREGD